MVNTISKFAGLFSIALLLLLLKTPLWATEMDVRQQQKDALLITAIKLNHTNQVVTLLAQGANPNAQYIPMSVHEIEAADTQNTWPLRVKNLRLPPPPTERAALAGYNRLNGHQPPVSALNVALDVTLDCPHDVTLPPRHTALIKALIEAGADVNARGCFNRTPLLSAMFNNHNDIVPLLLARHANVFARDDYGNTSLMAAVGMGNASLVQSLLKQGLEVNARNKYGMTPLMSACYPPTRSDPTIVQMLLERGADVNAKNKDGQTVLTLAKWYTNARIVSLLKKAGAK